MIQGHREAPLAKWWTCHKKAGQSKAMGVGEGSLFSVNTYSPTASAVPDSKDKQNEVQLMLQLFLAPASCLVAFTQLQPSWESS